MAQQGARECRSRAAVSRRHRLHPAASQSGVQHDPRFRSCWLAAIRKLAWRHSLPASTGAPGDATHSIARSAALSRMIRILTLLVLLAVLALSLRAIFADADPRRLRAAGWGALSGGLVVLGLWMLLA
jgi:hypothetical protein